MRQYISKISLIKNSRGVWDLDPFKGCYHGTVNNPSGCYGLCYAAKIAKFRGFDFHNVVYRYFEDDKHLKQIQNKLKKLPFVRLGVMCDPSHDWNHTLDIINNIREYQKNIVVITKHWTVLTDKQVEQLKGICVNTSISALDTEQQIKHRLEQYNRLKKYCNSVLRVNTCDFKENLFNEEKILQQKLLDNENVIDNILRMPKGCKYVKGLLVNIGVHNFLNNEITASKHNENTYFGNCKDCPDKCGISFFK